MQELKNAQTAAKALRDQNIGTSVSGYGTIAVSNPSDQTIDQWDAKQCKAFTDAVNAS